MAGRRTGRARDVASDVGRLSLRYALVGVASFAVGVALDVVTGQMQLSPSVGMGQTALAFAGMYGSFGVALGAVTRLAATGADSVRRRVERRRLRDAGLARGSAREAVRSRGRAPSEGIGLSRAQAQGPRAAEVVASARAARGTELAQMGARPARAAAQVTRRG